VATNAVTKAGLDLVTFKLTRLLGSRTGNGRPDGRLDAWGKESRFGGIFFVFSNF
jgi:hypothetical protein